MKAVSKTAYYCCGVRMQDAESQHPLIADVYARKLMGTEGLAYWEEFKEFELANASNTARHYVIDQHIKKLLQQQPDSTIILIGAGLDSRAFRLKTGNWIEIDETAIINYKNEVLPAAECKNHLQRITMDFEKETLADKLAFLSGKQNIIIVIEGVLMYLTVKERETFLDTITKLFPKHVLLCDLMNKKFFEKLAGALHQKLVASGTTFTDIAEKPDEIFLKRGYKEIEVTATIKAASDLGLSKVPKFVLNFLYKKLFLGYSVYYFSYGS